jgi:hypothetical protein
MVFLPIVTRRFRDGIFVPSDMLSCVGQRVVKSPIAGAARYNATKMEGKPARVAGDGAGMELGHTWILIGLVHASIKNVRPQLQRNSTSSLLTTN